MKSGMIPSSPRSLHLRETLYANIENRWGKGERTSYTGTGRTQTLLEGVEWNHHTVLLGAGTHAGALVGKPDIRIPPGPTPLSGTV